MMITSPPAKGHRKVRQPMRNRILIGLTLLLLLAVAGGAAYHYYANGKPPVVPPPVHEERSVNDLTGITRNSTLVLKDNADPEFFALKDGVNAAVLASLRPADDKPRRETRISEPIALRGTIVTPSQVIPDGIVVIEYATENLGRGLDNRLVSTIRTVAPYTAAAVPAGATLVDLTGNNIYPGFMDLHNHVMYNIYDLWTPTFDKYPSRDVWPGDVRYKDWKKLKFYFSKEYKQLVAEATKFGEIRELMGGGTMIQGFDGAFAASYGLIRNMENEGNLLGLDSINQSVMPISGWWGDRPRAVSGRERVLTALNGGKVTRYFIHFCEGIDDKIYQEFVKMREYNMLRPEFVGIHSTALQGDDWNDIARAGMKVVWSPLSNLILYNQTADIKGALSHGVPLRNISLGPDWSPSGSPNMLFEAKVAAEYNREKLNNLLTPRQIVSMMTENAANVCGYDQYLGQIKVGLRADLTVIKQQGDDPYQSVLDAPIEDVNLVLVDGQPLYGSLSYYEEFAKGNDYEVFKVNDVEKAIDITEDGIEKGDQTLAELFKILNDGFAEIKRTIPFEFLQDVDDYCRLAPLYWPRETSYRNLIFTSLMGRTSDNTQGDQFRSSEFYTHRNPQAADLFKKIRAGGAPEEETTNE